MQRMIQLRFWLVAFLIGGLWVYANARVWASCSFGYPVSEGCTYPPCAGGGLPPYVDECSDYCCETTSCNPQTGYNGSTYRYRHVTGVAEIFGKFETYCQYNPEFSRTMTASCNCHSD